jgi:lipopolysaccharide transport protein LptA
MKTATSYFLALLLLLAPAAVPVLAQIPDDASTEAQPPVGSTLIMSDELHSNQNSHQSIFTGNVVVVGQNFRMTCQEMTVFFTTDNKVTEIVATGDVIITQPDRVTHCGHAEYYQNSDTFVLTQEPVILNQGTEVRSTRITINRQTQQMQTEGGRTTVTISNKSMGPATTTPSGSGNPDGALPTAQNQ